MDFPLVLDNSFFPVQAFFNAMPRRAFIKTLEGFARGVGAGFNDAVCEFPGEVEFEGEEFDGVKFYLFSEELVIPNSDFMRFLEDVCQMYAGHHPQYEHLVVELMQRIAAKLGAGG
jgi:hypothetical protein